MDKLFRIVPEHIELIFPQVFQNGDHRPPGQYGALGHLADEVIRKMAEVNFLQRALVRVLTFPKGSPRPSSCSFISSFWRPTVAVYCSSETNSLSFHSQTYLKFLASHYAMHQGITSYNFIYVLIVCLKMFSAAFISYTNLSYGSTLSGIFSPSFITQISSLALTFFS